MNFLLRLPFVYRFFGPKDNSSSAARNRLKAALVSDRTTVAPALLDCIERDVDKALKSYLIYNIEKSEVAMRESEGQMMLSIRIPIERVRRQADLPEEALVESRPSAEIRLKGRKLRGKKRRSRRSQES